MNECLMIIWMHGNADGRLNVRVDGWMDGWIMDGCIGGWMDDWMDGCISGNVLSSLILIDQKKLNFIYKFYACAF